jgi:AcrR family transcriptional regulator
MARPQTVSDDVILEAAQRVISRRGYEKFTLSEVADEVGLSRAAIILRFKSTRALKLLLTKQAVDHFVLALAGLPLARGGDSLVELAAFVGAKISDRDRLASFFRMHRSNLDDDGLAALELKRANAWRKAIADRMPKTAVAHEAAVAAFAAHLSGSILARENETGVSAEAFLIERTKVWLKLTQIPFTQRRHGQRRSLG